MSFDFLERHQLDYCATIDLPKVQLDKNRRFDKITEPGLYFLERIEGAEDVDVFQQQI